MFIVAYTSDNNAITKACKANIHVWICWRYSLAGVLLIVLPKEVRIYIN